MIITYPATFSNSIQVNAKPTDKTNDGLPRVKLCSVVVTSSGENLPCPKCMNTGSLQSYSQNNESVLNGYDSFKWSLPQVRNFNFRTTADNPNVNKMT